MYVLHGGDWASFEERYGRKPLDFSASIAPFPLPESVKRAAAEAIGEGGYPDPLQRQLREEIARAHSLSADEILCGNGAADLIHRFASAARPRRVLLTAPTFVEYRAALSRFDSRIEEYVLSEKNDFRITKDILTALTSDLDAVFLCEPNNPTGKCTDPQLLDRIAERCAKLGVCLVIDESFHDFLPRETHPDSLRMLRNSDRSRINGQTPINDHDAQNASVRQRLTKEDNAQNASVGRELPGEGSVLILRSFTKFYAMAGLRLGWCASNDRDLLDRMRCEGQPWSVSTPAMRAGIAALRETSYAGELRSYIAYERERIGRALRELGKRVISGEANYLLFFDENDALKKQLEERGILIRDCSSYSGLGKGWYRIAIRTREENDILLAAMREIAGRSPTSPHIKAGPES